MRVAEDKIALIPVIAIYFCCPSYCFLIEYIKTSRDK